MYYLNNLALISNGERKMRGGGEGERDRGLGVGGRDDWWEWIGFGGGGGGLIRNMNPKNDKLSKSTPITHAEFD